MQHKDNILHIRASGQKWWVGSTKILQEEESNYRASHSPCLLSWWRSKRELIAKCLVSTVRTACQPRSHILKIQQFPSLFPTQNSGGNEEVRKDPSFNTMNCVATTPVFQPCASMGFLFTRGQGQLSSPPSHPLGHQENIFSVGGLAQISCHVLSSSSSSVRLSVSCEACWEGSLSCSQTVPVPVLERDMVARLRR